MTMLIFPPLKINNLITKNLENIEVLKPNQTAQTHYCDFYLFSFQAF